MMSGFGPRSSSASVYSRLQLQPEVFPKALTVQWLISASGAYSRATRNLAEDIKNSDLDDIEMCRIINDRIMTVRSGRRRAALDADRGSWRPLLPAGGAGPPVALRVSQRAPVPPHPAGLRASHAPGSVQPPELLQDQQPRGRRRPVPQPVCFGHLDHSRLR